MSIIKNTIFLSLLYLFLSQKTFPMVPNPGYDTITSHPIFDIGNENTSHISPLDKQNTISIIMTNGTIIVNTTNMDPQCNLECYTGCRVLFPEFIEQKYCIINLCKCQIIEKEVQLPENINSNNNYKNNSNSVQIANSEIHKYSTTAFVGIDNSKNKINLSEQFKNEKDEFYWIFYLLIFLFSLGYELYILNYISTKNEFSLIDWFNEKNDTQFKKYRNSNELENNNNELRRCLL